MTARAEQEARDVVAAYDFGGIGHLVDAGGGRGTLLAENLRAHPGLRATRLDRDATIPGATAHPRALGLAHRASCEPGDFVESVPLGADAYLLSRILHDLGRRRRRAGPAHLPPAELRATRPGGARALPPWPLRSGGLRPAGRTR